MTILGWLLFTAFVLGLILFTLASFKLAGDADAADQAARDVADREGF